MTIELAKKPQDARVGQIIKLAIMAVGGQGGGVLTSWIEALARSQGYVCQATSVAGVAQRTGATIYYIEMLPASELEPVFALAPSGGDVDVLIAAEMMEVGRAVMRGFVTPDRTTLIGSTHRALAVSEKMAPGDGIADADEVRAAAQLAAAHVILADMDQLAVAQGSVISSSLFGALAGSETLPFPREAFEQAIRASGKGVEASLKAFDAGFTAAQQRGATASAIEKEPVKAASVPAGPRKELLKWQTLIPRIEAMPDKVQQMAQAGIARLVEFQDCAYASLYLDRLEQLILQDNAAQDWEFSQNAAKYLAVAMAYDDIIRVADLKTRKTRFDRIRSEMDAKGGTPVELTEFFHPRAEEIASLLPAKIGARWEASPKRMALLDRFFNKGRRLRTHRMGSFFVLHVLGGLRAYRLKTRRHEVETAHLDAWQESCVKALKEDYALGVELLKNRRLIKGYSDTHARGLSKFSQVMDMVAVLKGRKDAAEWMGRLREAALQDPEGKALEGAIKTVKSFT